MGAAQVALPPGFVLDDGPALPPGFVLDGGQADQPLAAKKPEPLAAKAANMFGVPETALSLATAIGGRGAGLVAAGVGGMLPGKEGQAERWLKGTQAALTYQPRSDAGKAIMGGIGEGVEWVANRPAVKRLGDAVEAVGEASPVAGAAMKSVPDLLGLLGARAPLMSAASKTKNAATGAMQSGAQSLMYSALKPTLKQHVSGDAKIAVETLLKHGINPTAGGVEKLSAMIDDVNMQIADRIGASKAVIGRDKVSTYLDPVRSKFANQVNPTPDLVAIEKVAADFANRAEGIPVQRAQSLKQGTYRVLKGKYGEEGVASTEAQKGLARGLKEEIAAAVPEIAGLNALDSQLIKTLSVAERRALMDMNKNPLGLSVLAHSPTGIAAFMADKSALFKSLVARMLNRASGGAKPTPMTRPAAPPEFNPSLGYGFENTPVAGRALAPQSPLGDLTPNWTTSPGAGLLREPGVEAAGLVRSFDDPRVGTSRLKGRPQMPMAAGLLGVDDTAIAGRKWVDAADGAPSRMAQAPMAVGGIELSRIINMPKSAHRTKLLNDFKKRYPEAVKYIEENI